MTGTAEVLREAEPKLLALSIESAERRASYIQGFDYNGTYVIRDVVREPSRQELWRGLDEGEFRARLTVLKFLAVAKRLSQSFPALLQAADSTEQTS